MTDELPAGDSPASHEGPDESNELLREPVSLEQLAEAIRDLESRMRQEHAMKRAAFEARLTQKFEERWAKARSV